MQLPRLQVPPLLPRKNRAAPMSEHFPENAIGEDCVTWCNVCKGFTRHRLDRVAVNSHAAKAGPCLEHGPRVELTKTQTKRRESQRQKELFP